MAHTTIATSPGVSPETLAALSSPPHVPSPFGTLEFFDGLPLPETVAASYDALDLLRGIDVYLNCISGASTVAIRRGLRSVGATRAQAVCYTDPRLDSAELVLTGNTETTYGTTFLDLATDGPTVIEPPTNSLCLVNDFWQRWVADLGLAGPDQGRGGKYLFLPPGYDGTVPDGYFVYRTPTYTNWLVLRALGGVDSLKTTRIYPLAAADNPPEMEFINTRGADFNTIHTNDFSYFEELDTLVQEEPTTALDPERTGLLVAIGIVKGQPFAPDERARRILDTAPAGRTRPLSNRRRSSPHRAECYRYPPRCQSNCKYRHASMHLYDALYRRRHP